MTYTYQIKTKTETRIVTVDTKPASEEPGYMVYNATCNDRYFGSGVVANAEILKKMITRTARRVLVNVTSVKQI